MVFSFLAYQHTDVHCVWWLAQLFAFFYLQCCSGGIIDTPANGPAPLPWDIPASPPEKFKNTTGYVEVPHTASVKVCFHLFLLFAFISALCVRNLHFFPVFREWWNAFIYDARIYSGSWDWWHVMRQKALIKIVKRLICHRGTAWRAMSVEILSAVRLCEKSHLKRLAICK